MPSFTARESLTQEQNEIFADIYLHLTAIENTVALSSEKTAPDAPSPEDSGTTDTITADATPSTDATGTDASANTATA